MPGEGLGRGGRWGIVRVVAKAPEVVDFGGTRRQKLLVRLRGAGTVTLTLTALRIRCSIGILHIGRGREEVCWGMFREPARPGGNRHHRHRWGGRLPGMEEFLRGSDAKDLGK